MRAVVVDPEVMFVASLMKADAPALVAVFQSEITLQLDDDGSQSMKAELRDLSVLACPLIRNQMDKAVTTVSSPARQVTISRTTELNKFTWLVDMTTGFVIITMSQTVLLF